jgi:hypothetical protein
MQFQKFFDLPRNLGCVVTAFDEQAQPF